MSALPAARLLVRTLLLYVSGCWASHLPPAAGCFDQSLSLSATSAMWSSCPSTHIIQGFFLSNRCTEDSCDGTTMSSLRCCQIDQTNTFSPSTESLMDFDNDETMYGCGNGYFMQGFYTQPARWGQLRWLPNSGWERAKCVRLPSSFPSNSQTSYLVTSQPISTGSNNRWTWNSWAMCPSGMYLLAWKVTKGNPWWATSRLDRVSAIACAKPHDKECPTTSLMSSTVDATWDCTHQRCIATQTCKAGFRGTTRTRTCENTGNWAGTPATCTNINECESACVAGQDPTTDNCYCEPPPAGSCSDRSPGFTCSCGPGHSGPNCANNNECLRPCGNEDPVTDNCHPCDLARSDCVNLVGPTGYECICKAGYEMNQATSSCDDVNECLETPCPANAVCANTAGGYTCACNAGFSGVDCDNNNECERVCGQDDVQSPLLDNCNDCELVSTDCVDDTVNAGYTCECKQGWERNTLSSCMDTNECAGGNLASCGHIDSKCYNWQGGYGCAPYISSVTYSGSSLQSLPDLGPHQVEITIIEPTPDTVWVLRAAGMFFGPPETPVDFNCPGNATVTPIVCTVQGAGANLTFPLVYYLSPAPNYAVWAAPSTPILFSYPPPTLTIDTLRLNQSDVHTSSGGAGTGVESKADVGGQLVFMDGTNFFPGGAPHFLVTLGKSPPYTDFACTLVDVTYTTLSCRTTAEAVGSGLRFRVTVGRGSSAQFVTGQDWLNLPLVPQIMSVKGCVSDVAGIGTTLCPTEGRRMLTLNVTNTPDLTGVNVLVGSSPCPVQSSSFVNGGDFQSFTCQLPEGVGLLRPILLTVGAQRVFSPLYPLVSYAPPYIFEMSGGGCVQTGNLTLSACRREGGFDVSLRGINFGRSGARVLVGGEIVIATHLSKFVGSGTDLDFHRHLVFSLPAFQVVATSPIFVLQSNGQQNAGNNAQLSYASCPAGTTPELGGPACVKCERGSWDMGEACTQCEAGHFQPMAGQQLCIPCPPGEHQPNVGQRACAPCAAGRHANLSGTIACLPCPVGTSSEAGARQCKACPAGTHQPVAGGTCQPCLSGFFSIGDRASLCLPCPAGFVSQRNGSTGCDACPRGHLQPEMGKDYCNACPVGHYNDGLGRDVCNACPPGHTTNLTGQVVCPQCPLGTFQPQAGLTICQPCSPGQYANSLGSVACSLCDAGRASAEPQQSACTACAKGRSQSEEGQTYCESCVAGRSANGEGSRVCTACLPRSYQPNNESSACILCDAGRFSNAAEATACAPCAPGQAQNAVGQPACNDCPPGTVSNGTGNSGCTRCLAGTFVTEPGRTQCDLCPTGTYSNTGASTCKPCFSGSYAALPGQSACGLCPRSAEANKESTKCLCGVGLFAITRVNGPHLEYECKLCPPGGVCDHVGTELNSLQTRPGWWRGKNTSLEFYRCLMPSACPGGMVDAVTGEIPCALHRTGVLCGVCEEGYASSGSNGDCMVCPESKGTAWGLSALVVVLVLLLLCVMYAVVLKVSNVQQRGLLAAYDRRNETEQEQLKDLLDGVGNEADEETGALDDEEDEDLTELERKQLQRKNRASRLKSSTTTGFGDSFGASTTSSTRLQSLNSMRDRSNLENAEFDNKKLTGARSMVSRKAPNFMYKAKIMVGFFQIATIISFQGEVSWPRHFGSFIAIFNVLNFDFVPWQTLGCATGITFYGKAVVVSLIPVGVLVLLSAAYGVSSCFVDKTSMSSVLTSDQRRMKVRRQFVKLLLFTSFLLYPFVSRMILSVYNCQEIEGTSYLLADLRLLCGDEAWTIYASGLSLAVVVYPIGIPLAYYVFLQKHRSHFRSPGVILQLGFLYEAYTDDRWFWEMLDMLHKLLLTSIVSFLPNFMEMVSHMVILMVYLMMLLLLNPYIRKGDDRLHLLAQTELYLLALVGWILQSTEQGQLSNIMELLVSTCLICLTSGFLVYFLVITGRTMRKFWKLKRKEDKAKKQASA